MTLTKKGRHWYGETSDALKAEIIRYSQKNKYEAVRFAEPACPCGGQLFELHSEDNEGVAGRVCTACDEQHLIGDSEEHIEGVELEQNVCLCGAEGLHLMVGVALYADSDDVRWSYIGARCPGCGMVGVFSDWKSEAGDATAFLKNA